MSKVRLGIGFYLLDFCFVLFKKKKKSWTCPSYSYPILPFLLKLILTFSSGIVLYTCSDAFQLEHVRSDLINWMNCWIISQGMLNCFSSAWATWIRLGDLIWAALTWVGFCHLQMVSQADGGKLGSGEAPWGYWHFHSDGGGQGLAGLGELKHHRLGWVAGLFYH